MATYRGMFYGYREWRKVGGRIQLGIWELDGKLPTRNTTYDGNAADAYPAMTVFPNSEQALAIWVQTWNNSLFFKLSNDAVSYQDEVEVDPDKNLGSWFHRSAARGICLKNQTPGAAARYQVVVFFA